MRALFAVFLGVFAVTGAAEAHRGPEHHCDVPLENWQPRDAVIAQFTALGWSVDRVRVDDGCYLVFGLAPDGKPAVIKVDPATLKATER